MDGLTVLIVLLGFACLYIICLCDKWERKQREREESRWEVKEDLMRQQIIALEGIADTHREMLRNGK